MRRVIITIGLVGLVLGITPFAMAGNWTTVDYYQGANTFIRGIDGSNLVGSYYSSDSGGSRGFFYDGTTWTTLHMQSAGETWMYGIDGSNIVGTAGLSGVLYNTDSQDWAILNAPMPGALTTLYGIDGSNIVGAADYSGVLYNTDSQEWAILNVPVPEATETMIYGIDGDNLVGAYSTGIDWDMRSHGFLYNTANQTWTFPEIPGAWNSRITGIDGSNIVGGYLDASGYHGFLYNGSSWTNLDMPGASWIEAYGIDGSNIVGSYLDASGYHGFLYTIPEPASLLLFGTGLIGLLARNKRIARIS